MNGNPDKSVVYTISAGSDVPNPFYGPFGVAIDKNDNVFVSCGGNGSPIPGLPTGAMRLTNSYVLKLSYSKKGGIVKLAEYNAGGFAYYRGLDVDSNGNIYVASFLQNSVLKFDNNLNLLATYTSPNSGPWGITIDSAGYIWVARFMSYLSTPATATFGLSKLVDNGNITLVGTFQLPSGGAPVQLATGQTLLNSAGAPVMAPLMRQTYASADAAGNVYSTNNWKPDIFVDVGTILYPNGTTASIPANPGGDGIIIFVGAGSPRNL